MERGWYFRLTIVLATTLGSLYMLYPSYFYYFKATPQQRDSHEAFCAALPSQFPCIKFNLGLDLQGGVHLVMGVRVDKAVEQRADRMADSLKEGLKEQKLPFARIDRPKDTSEIDLVMAPTTSMDAVEKYLRRDYRSLDVLRRLNQELMLDLSSEEKKYVREATVDQAIKTIRNRADKFGVSEPVIAKRGDDSVLIQLPGISDPDRAIANIGRMAQLEFKMVDSEATAVFDDVPASSLPEGVTKHEDSFDGPGGKNIREVSFLLPETQEAALTALLEPKLPNDRDIGFGSAGPESPNGKATLVRTYLLHHRAGITGDYLTDAHVQQSTELASDYYVVMTFDPKGAKIFEHLTEENVRRKFAIVLDGKVTSAPIIEEKIPGGTARITLGRGGADAQTKFEEAKDLSLVLKAGALPAPVEVREKRTVGQTLGKDAITKGSRALFFGMVFVLIFMVMYYRLSGFLADLAVTLNLFLVLGVMAMFGATLTLPGMAGIVLTVGMAVDANVLIYERIREELRVGKTPRAAIEAGYARAFVTILDSHITDVVAAIVLFQYGSGPVRGFAVTLIIGISASLYTALVVTRLIYDYFTATRRVQTLSI